jgi:hypothetical protein
LDPCSFQGFTLCLCVEFDSWAGCRHTAVWHITSLIICLRFFYIGYSLLRVKKRKFQFVLHKFFYSKFLLPLKIPSEITSPSSIGTTARSGLWPVEQYPSIFSYLSPTLSIIITFIQLFLFSTFVTISFLLCGVVSPTPNPQPGGPGGTLVKVLCYKSEGRWFDSR